MDLRFSLTLRDVEELMAERGLSVDHTTVWHWTQTHAPEVQRRLHGQLKPKGSTWHIDETFVRIWSLDVLVPRRRQRSADGGLLFIRNSRSGTPGTHFWASFGHLGGYCSAYYTYL